MIAVLLMAAAPAQCHQLHYLENGRLVESWVADPDKGSADGAGSASAQSSARSSGSGSAHSSVTARSSGAGHASASSSSSADGKHRSVSITRDERGCTIIIDERTPQGGKR